MSRLTPINYEKLIKKLKKIDFEFYRQGKGF